MVRARSSRLFRYGCAGLAGRARRHGATLGAPSTGRCYIVSQLIMLLLFHPSTEAHALRAVHQGPAGPMHVSRGQRAMSLAR